MPNSKKKKVGRESNRLKSKCSDKQYTVWECGESTFRSSRESK